jgi:uncharacterized membrane protein YcaP (DUF421 family)
MGKWKFLLDGWQDLFGTALSGLIAYFAILTFIRIGGKRTLAKMNVFDFVCVVALGSMLGSTVLTPGVPLLRGVLGIALILGIQYLLSKVACRCSTIQQLINGTPQLVFSRGQYLEAAMRRERVTHEMVRAVIRARGYPRLKDIHSVILETDGSFSVIPEKHFRPDAEPSDGVLCDVDGERTGSGAVQ